MQRFKISAALFGLAAVFFVAACAPDAPPTAPAGKALDAGTCAVDADGFDIELVYLDRFTAAQRAAIDSAAARWEQVITADLPDYDFAGQPFVEYRRYLRRTIRTDTLVDDLRIYVGKQQLAGNSAWAGPFYVRSYDDGRLPVLGQMIFDPEGVRSIERDGLLRLLALHEIGHVLGIGTTFDLEGVELLTICDTPHFTGWGARWAFSMAGGDRYEGAKVPVAADLAHWDAGVLGDELMVNSLPRTARAPLSAVTVAALGDLGYEVNPLAADAYALPNPSAAKPSAPPTFFCGVSVVGQ